MVEHRGDVIVQTDLNTGEHTARLVEIKEVPKVISYQESPATTKKIEGRTVDVDVLSDGGVRLTAQEQKGPHTVVERGEGSVAPNYDTVPDAVPEAAPAAPPAAEASEDIFQEAEKDEGGILDTAASDRGPEDAPSPDGGAENASEAIIAMAGSETQSEQDDNAFRDLEMADDDAGAASAASEEDTNQGTDNLMDEANSVIDHSVDSTLDEGAAEEDEDLINDGPSPDPPSAGDALRELASKVGNSGNTPPTPPVPVPVPSDSEGEEAAQAQAGEEEAAFTEGYQRASYDAQAAGVPLPDLSQAQAENRRIIVAGMSPEERRLHMADWYASFLNKKNEDDIPATGEAANVDSTITGDQPPQDGGGFLSGLMGGGEPKSRFRAVSDVRLDVSEAAPGASGEPAGSLSGRLRRRKMQEERKPRKAASGRSGGGARGRRGMVPRL